MNFVGLKGPLGRIWNWNVLPKPTGLSVWVPKWHNWEGVELEQMLCYLAGSLHVISLSLGQNVNGSLCHMLPIISYHHWPKATGPTNHSSIFNPKQTTLHLKSVVLGIYYTCILQCFSDFSVSSTLEYYLLFKLQKNWAEAAKIYHIPHLNAPSINNIFNNMAYLI